LGKTKTVRYFVLQPTVSITTITTKTQKKKKREYKEIEIGPLFLMNVRRLAVLLPFMMTAGPEII
jgi:hypothetical protein